MNSQDSDIPDDLRSAWQETRVRTPEALDRAVLKEAAAAAAGRSKRFLTGLQPLAYAATLLLGVALVYEMQTPVRDPAPASADATSLEEAAGAGVGEMEKSADGAPAVREPAIRSLLNDRRIHELKATPSAAADSRQTAPATGRAEKSSVAGRQPGASECREAETDSPEDWWTCIGSLREAGLDASAAAELERLQARYPDFTPPQ